MKLPNNVKVKRFPWTILPIFSKYTAHAFYPYIYVPENIYNDLKSKKPDPKNIATLIHEQTHIRRQRETGCFTWGLKYVLSGKFRLEEELIAIKAAMKYQKSKNIAWNTERHAKFLSSYLYFWCVSYKEAKKQLDEAWEKA